VPCTPLIINEWLFHDLGGENGREAQERAYEFLLALRDGDDCIAALRPSRWMDKAYALMKVTSPEIRILSKLLHLGILLDSAKCLYVEADNLDDLPVPLAEEVPGDDAYLFQTALAIGAKVIVTSDKRLIGLAGSAPEFDIQLRLRDEFIAEYLNAWEDMRVSLEEDE
jgi:hypothetical protein